MYRAFLVAAILAAVTGAFVAGGSAALAGETPSSALPSQQSDDFTLDRAYFGTSETAVSGNVRGLIRSLERAREMRPVSSNQVLRPYSLEAALWEQSWRRRVGAQLETLLK